MRSSTKVRVLIVDDFRLVRQGLRSLLEDAPAVAVVGDTDSHFGPDWVEQSRPQVVLWAVRSHELCDRHAFPQIVAQCAKLPVLLLATQTSELAVRRARQAGAAGYIYMDCTPQRLIQAVLDCVQDPGFISILGPEQDPPSVSLPSLSRRQSQVLRLAARGYRLPEIAAKLNMSIRTAERYRAHIKQVLGIHDSAGLVRYALRNGLISESHGAFQ